MDRYILKIYLINNECLIIETDTDIHNIEDEYNKRDLIHVEGYIIPKQSILYILVDNGDY